MSIFQARRKQLEMIDWDFVQTVFEEHPFSQTSFWVDEGQVFLWCEGWFFSTSEDFVSKAISQDDAKKMWNRRIGR